MSSCVNCGHPVANGNKHRMGACPIGMPNSRKGPRVSYMPPPPSDEPRYHRGVAVPGVGSRAAARRNKRGG